MIFVDTSDSSASATIHVWSVEEGRDATSTLVYSKTVSLVNQWDVNIAHNHEVAHKFKK